MHIFYFIVVLSFFFGCSPEKESAKKIESLERQGPDRKYEIGMACMEYVLRDGDDLNYSKTLTDKLLEHGFFAETILALESLLSKFPNEADLWSLRATAYRKQHQYDLALVDCLRAIQLQPDNERFATELHVTRQQHKTWMEIQSLNESLEQVKADSFATVLARAEKFYLIQEYDAVLFDLGLISRMRGPADSIYYHQQVSALYKDDRLPVKRLEEMLEHFKNAKGAL